MTWRGWTALVLLAFVLYVLSAGPAAWLVVHVLPEWTHPPVAAVYMPLQFVISALEFISPDPDMPLRLWMTYLDLWVDTPVLGETP